MDRQAVKTTVEEWIATLVAANREFAWLKNAGLTAEPACLVDAQTKEGDNYTAGAVSVVVTPHSIPDGAVEKLSDAVVGDRTLGHRAKRAHSERPGHESEAGTVVVIPL